MRSLVLSIAMLTMAAVVCSQQQKSPTPAELYESGMNDLTGSERYRDESRGIERIRRSADLGYAPAQTAMAFYGVEPDRAFSWCKKAAEQGDVVGQWCVGQRYFDGDGVMRSVTDAEKWLRLAAAQGNAFAAYTIGLIKEDREPKAQLPWFQQAAEQGLVQAQRKLVRLYREGRYVPKDNYRAYVWLLISLENGATDTARLTDLEADLGMNQVNKAKSEARELVTRFTRRSVQGCTGWEGEFDSPPKLPPLAVQRFCR